jgi:tRNA 2-thiouridine synthesizing protein A
MLVDARGMRCPWPVLRLSRAARQLQRPGAIRILADDPLAATELQQLCAERGWSFSPCDQESAFDVVIG